MPRYGYFCPSEMCSVSNASYKKMCVSIANCFQKRGCAFLCVNCLDEVNFVTLENVWKKMNSTFVSCIIDPQNSALVEVHEDLSLAESSVHVFQSYIWSVNLRTTLHYVFKFFLYFFCKSPDKQSLKATSRCGLQLLFPEADATYS